MRTDSINNTNFQMKKFREPARFAVNMERGSSKSRKVLRNYMIEYSNLNAETIYGNARTEKTLGDWNSSANLYSKMSKYKTIEQNFKERVLSFIKDFKKRVFK